MTPMVDLAFLLVTFFCLTTSMMKPRAMELIYPKTEGDPMKVNRALTILLGRTKAEVYYYTGEFKREQTVLLRTDFSRAGLRSVLLEHNSDVNSRLAALAPPNGSDQANESTPSQESIDQLYQQITGDERALMVLVKTLPETPYYQVVTTIDELNICNVMKRAIQDMSPAEESLFLKQKVLE